MKPQVRTYILSLADHALVHISCQNPVMRKVMVNVIKQQMIIAWFSGNNNLEHCAMIMTTEVLLADTVWGFPKIGCK